MYGAFIGLNDRETPHQWTWLDQTYQEVSVFPKITYLFLPKFSYLFVYVRYNLDCRNSFGRSNKVRVYLSPLQIRLESVRQDILNKEPTSYKQT